MSPSFARVATLTITSSLFALSMHFFFGSVLAAAPKPVLEAVMRDKYEDGIHRLSGTLLVPSDCYELSANTYDLDGDTTVIVLETWEQPYRDCAADPVPRSFEVLSFAPEGTRFLGILNEDWLSVRFIEE